MLSSSLIITQLPSSLWNSPIFEAYDYYTDEGLDTLQSDIEEMFFLTDVTQLNNYLLSLKLKLAVREHRKRLLEELSGFDRLINACAYTEYPVDSVFWLLKLTHNVDVLKHPFRKSGLQLMTGRDYLGAIIGPIKTETLARPRAFIG